MYGPFADAIIFGNDSSVSCSLIFNQFDPSIYKRNRVENRY